MSRNYAEKKWREKLESIKKECRKWKFLMELFFMEKFNENIFSLFSLFFFKGNATAAGIFEIFPDICKYNM